MRRWYDLRAVWLESVKGWCYDLMYMTVYYDMVFLFQTSSHFKSFTDMFSDLRYT